MYFKYYDNETKEWEVTNLLFLRGIYILIAKALRPQEYTWIEKISLCEVVSFSVLKEIWKNKNN